jgi:hypothetical protein
MTARSPGRPRTTGSRDTAPIVFRVGAVERAAAEREAKRRRLSGPNELARVLLLDELEQAAARIHLTETACSRKR